MSPRSEESAAQARDRPAARVALSERDMNAKTHGGTRALFAEQFVQDGVDAGWLRFGDEPAEPIAA
jgi:hypothetical protein